MIIIGTWVVIDGIVAPLGTNMDVLESYVRAVNARRALAATETERRAARIRVRRARTS